MSDIETEIQSKGLTAPRVTPADIEAYIKAEYYFTARDAVLAHLQAQAQAQARPEAPPSAGASAPLPA